MNIIHHIVSILFGKKNQGPRPGHGGFTLVEAMVAIAILSMAVTGPLLIAQKGIGSAIYAREQITAFYLAQEAVEYIRNIRDTNRITRDPWLTNLTACVGAVCRIDGTVLTSGEKAVACSSDPGAVCKPLWLGSVTGLYGYTESGATQTPFTRSVSIVQDSSQQSAKISVTVSWTTKLFTPVRSFTIQEYIFNF